MKVSMQPFEESREVPLGASRKRPRRRFPIFACYAVLMVAFSTYVVLDTFVIQRTFAVVQTSATQRTGQGPVASGAVSVTSSSTGDDVNAGEGTSAIVNTSISTYTYEGSTVYVADVYANDVHALLTAFANDAYGHNVSATTSTIASNNSASLAINGDCYGMRNAGYVVRNGVLYRSESAGSNQEDLVIYEDGTFEIIREGDVTAQALVDKGAWQVFSFGPGLVQDGQVIVSEGDEVGRAMASNPRTAIGKVADGHYVLVVSDGRTSESAGLSLRELATFMADELGVECAYNLDGGGSSTMVYENSLVNKPTTNGHSIQERGVTDIVYIAE